MFVGMSYVNLLWFYNCYILAHPLSVVVTYVMPLCILPGLSPCVVLRSPQLRVRAYNGLYQIRII